MPSPTSPDGSPPNSARLDGRTFLSVSIMKAGVDRPLVPNSRIRLDFGKDGRLGVNAGCNTLGATYRLEAGILETSGGAMTEMGCPQPAQTQDEWVFAYALSGPAVALNRDELTLTQGELVGRFLDREVADPDRPLVGTTWFVSTILSRDTASSIPQGIRATLLFGADGRVAVDTSCNTGGGTYTIGGAQITFGPIALTKKGCRGASGEMERAVAAILLADHLTYEIQARSLWIKSAGIGLGLTAG
jgi:heat shock protein HslJ